MNEPDEADAAVEAIRFEWPLLPNEKRAIAAALRAYAARQAEVAARSMRSVCATTAEECCHGVSGVEAAIIIRGLPIPSGWGDVAEGRKAVIE